MNGERLHLRSGEKQCTQSIVTTTIYGVCAYPRSQAIATGLGMKPTHGVWFRASCSGQADPLASDYSGNKVTNLSLFEQ